MINTPNDLRASFTSPPPSSTRKRSAPPRSILTRSAKKSRLGDSLDNHAALDSNTVSLSNIPSSSLPVDRSDGGLSDSMYDSDTSSVRSSITVNSVRSSSGAVAVLHHADIRLDYYRSAGRSRRVSRLSMGQAVKNQSVLPPALPVEKDPPTRIQSTSSFEPVDNALEEDVQVSLSYPSLLVQWIKLCLFAVLLLGLRLYFSFVPMVSLSPSSNSNLIDNMEPHHYKFARVPLHSFQFSTAKLNLSSPSAKFSEYDVDDDDHCFVCSRLLTTLQHINISLSSESLPQLYRSPNPAMLYSNGFNRTLWTHKAFDRSRLLYRGRKSTHSSFKEDDIVPINDPTAQLNGKLPTII